MRFFDLLTITVRSDLLSVTNSIPIMSELDCDTFILVRAKVLDLREHFPVLF